MTDTGLAIAPGPVAIVMSSFLAQKLNEKLPVGLVAASGFGIIAVGQILMLLLLKSGGHSYAADILPTWFLIGIGFGLSLPTIIGSATTDLPAKLSATGSAVVNSGRQIGGVFGTAVLVLILGKAATTGDPTVLPPVVGSGRRLRRCRRDVPRSHPPWSDRGGEGYR